ncbi:transmembrane protein, putative [Rhizoctonia solani AG-3 Rhs1AP]|uniref:Transmembrane protein, putative n=2 Tax=Rhizoctonia solani AG-3 TaxID=1086053 RepID=X8IVJ7_9AGAM|nr:transmembrane protein, putative [Rhizoctonia solani AG-3 Rhs1AP]KEP50308.1 putative transmembrane protein [Rhizoctonia solani 123E]
MWMWTIHVIWNAFGGGVVHGLVVIWVGEMRMWPLSKSLQVSPFSLPKNLMMIVNLYETTMRLTFSSRREVTANGRWGDRFNWARAFISGQAYFPMTHLPQPRPAPPPDPVTSLAQLYSLQPTWKSVSIGVWTTPKTAQAPIA